MRDFPHGRTRARARTHTHTHTQKTTSSVYPVHLTFFRTGEDDGAVRERSGTPPQLHHFWNKLTPYQQFFSHHQRLAGWLWEQKETKSYWPVPHLTLIWLSCFLTNSHLTFWSVPGTENDPRYCKEQKSALVCDGARHTSAWNPWSLCMQEKTYISC